MNALEKIIKIVEDFKDLDGMTITEATTFAELELDSLDTVDMVMACEEEFGVSIQFDESLKTIGNLIELIEKGEKA